MQSRAQSRGVTKRGRQKVLHPAPNQRSMSQSTNPGKTLDTLDVKAGYRLGFQSWQSALRIYIYTLFRCFVALTRSNASRLPKY